MFAETTVQTCIVHLIRNSLDYATWKDRRAVAVELKAVYRAPSKSGRQAALEAFANGPGAQLNQFAILYPGRFEARAA